MTDVIRVAADLGPPGPDPHDGSVTASPTPSYSGLGLPALRRLTWWVTAACLLVIIGLVIAESVTGPAVGGAAGSTLVGVAVTGVCGAAGVLFASSLLGRPVLPDARWRATVVLAVLVAGGLLTVSRAGGEGGFPWPLPLAAVLAAAHVGSGNPWRRVWPAGLSFALVASLCGSWWGGEVPWASAVEDAAMVVIAAWGLLAQVWMLRVVDHLDQARRLESAAAVTGERLRFAADLHDIQGHNLQVIALKSELAERLAGVDPERAVAEMREVQELARQALVDTRAVVQGYRRVRLETELANAARVLTAAGIDCRVERDPDAPGCPEPVAALVGLVVREGTTNVLRHSEAGHCAITLTASTGGSEPDGAGGSGTLRAGNARGSARIGGLRLVMRNDKPLGGQPGPAGGLAALADRMIDAGGTLRWRIASGQFVLEATFPGEPPPSGDAASRRRQGAPDPGVPR